MADSGHQTEVPASVARLLRRRFQRILQLEAQLESRDQRIKALEEERVALEALVDRLREAMTSRDQRISQLEEAADIVLEAEALLTPPNEARRQPSSAWMSAVAILRHARREPDIYDVMRGAAGPWVRP